MVNWLPPADDFRRGLADRSEEFDQFKSMLSGRSVQRALLVQGPSNSGKSAFLQECIRYAEHQRMSRCHFDFKNGRPLEEFFEALLLDLEEDALPQTAGSKRSERSLKVVADLQRSRKPCFIAFDTYEQSPQSGQDWIEKELLPRLGRCPGLVVAVAGQIVPERSGRSWAPFAYTSALPPILSGEDWLDYALREHGAIAATLEQLEFLTTAAKGNPGTMSALVQNLAVS
jgi:hypothetical protein